MTIATVDLGKIKFQWKGDWSSSASYTRDDVVHYQGQAYVCKLANTNSTPTVGSADWDLLAAGGDPATVMTNQGDLLVRGAAGLERLATGTADQKLVVSGGVPAWQSELRILQRVHRIPYPGAWEAVASYADVPGMNLAITPQRLDTRLRLHWTWCIYWTGNHSILHHRFFRIENTSPSWTQIKGWTEGGQYQEKNVNFLWDEPTSDAITSVGNQVTYKLQARDYSHNGNGANFHGTTYWDGAGGNVSSDSLGWAGPVLTIEEYLP